MVTTQTPDWPAEAAPAVRNEPGPPARTGGKAQGDKAWNRILTAALVPDNSKKRLKPRSSRDSGPAEGQIHEGHGLARASPIIRLRMHRRSGTSVTGLPPMCPIVAPGKSKSFSHSSESYRFPTFASLILMNEPFASYYHNRSCNFSSGRYVSVLWPYPRA